MQEYCEKYSVALYAHDTNQKRYIFARARCKQWDCTYCAEVNRKQWLKRMIEGIKKIGDENGWAFWTLTHDLDHALYLEQRRTLSSAWNRLAGQIKYHAGYAIYYIRAIEIGANSTRRMHMHTLINYVPSDLEKIHRADGTHYWRSVSWFARAERAGFGRIADIRDLSGTQEYIEPEIALGSDLETTRAVLTASYIAKYMTKTDEQTERRFPKRTRRFNTSRNFPELQDEESFKRYNWKKGEKPNQKIAEACWRHDLSLVDIQRGTKISYDDFDEGGEYIY